MDWIRRFVLHTTIGTVQAKVEAFLTHLAVGVCNRGGRGMRSPLDAVGV